MSSFSRISVVQKQDAGDCQVLCRFSFQRAFASIQVDTLIANDLEDFQGEFQLLMLRVMTRTYSEFNVHSLIDSCLL